MDDLKQATDEQIETELKTLSTKTDATKEEKEKLQVLKEERTTRYQKRLDRLTFEKKSEAEKSKRLEDELTAQRKELEDLKKSREEHVKPIIVDEHVEYGGKKYYTDKALQSMVEAKELDPQQAYQHQQQRLKAEIKDDIKRESQQQESVSKNKRIWDEDMASVLKEYPEFNPSHSAHNPEDPLYKLASEIYRDDFTVEGQVVNPRALSLSIKRAKQILKTDTRPDVSDEQTIRRPGSSSAKGTEQITLSQTEQDVAASLYKNVINPATNKTYTEQEAINKALKTKKARGR